MKKSLRKVNYSEVVRHDFGALTPIAQAVTQALVGAGISLTFSNLAISQSSEN